MDDSSAFLFYSGLNYPGELLLTCLFSEVDIETDTDITDQQAPGWADADLTVFNVNQFIVDKGLQQLEIFGEVLFKLDPQLLLHLGHIKFKVTDKLLDHRATDFIITIEFTAFPQSVALLIYGFIVRANIFWFCA